MVDEDCKSDDEGASVRDVYDLYQALAGQGGQLKVIRCRTCREKVQVTFDPFQFPSEFCFGCQTCDTVSVGWPGEIPGDFEGTARLYGIIQGKFYIDDPPLPRLVWRVSGMTRFLSVAEPTDPDYDTADRLKF